jgi:hypothetical protein
MTRFFRTLGWFFKLKYAELKKPVSIIASIIAGIILFGFLDYYILCTYLGLPVLCAMTAPITFAFWIGSALLAPKAYAFVSRCRLEKDDSPDYVFRWFVVISYFSIWLALLIWGLDWQYFDGAKDFAGPSASEPIFTYSVLVLTLLVFEITSLTVATIHGCYWLAKHTTMFVCENWQKAKRLSGTAEESRRAG